MSKKDQNVFERLQETLATVIEQLSNANDALYVMATTAIDLNDKLDALTSKLDAALGIATKVTEKSTEIQQAPKIPLPKFSFEKLRQEIK